MQRARRGFAIAELGLSLLLAGVILTGYLYLQKSNTIKEGYIDKMAFLKSYDTGTQASMLDIIRAYETVNSTITDTDARWGWSKSPSVNPFPIIKNYSGVPHILYELQGGIITATQLTSLKKKIFSHFKDVCYDATSKLGGASNVVIFCPLLTDIKYDLPSGVVNVATPFTKGTFITPESPVVNIKFKKFDGLNNSFTIDTFTFSMNNTFQSLKNLSSERILSIRNAMEGFSATTKLKELRNPQNINGSGGLNNADDEFVPWHWKIFGNNVSNIKTSICTKGVGGGECTNLKTNNIWRAGASIRRGLITRRISNTLFGGDTSVNIDGFGNAIYTYPITSDCAGANFMTCTIKAPSIPKDNYMNVGNPPYLSIIYTEAYRLKTSSSKPYGKMYVSY